ncbi:plasmalemma vesicle-associated protein [Ascaphus truei]|uniref:plasmalemma vesicle-associated protein n=1 Tax=Ascaphus truei TaxID=8439 RepID=UPI003F59B267
MDKSYAMAKFGLESKDILRSKQKSCWFYFKYFFLFTSIIQFLIILGLVLFMVYGNAHVGTETRLQNVEDLNKKLLKEVQQLKGGIGALNTKLNYTEQERHRGIVMLQKKTSELDGQNRTLQFLMQKNQELMVIQLQYRAVYTQCERYKGTFDNLNLSCIAQRLYMQDEKNRLDLEFKIHKDNCSKNMVALGTRTQQAEAEREKYQLQMINLRNEKSDIGKQVEKFKESCTSIDEKFRAELQRLKETFEATFKKTMPDTLLTSQCSDVQLTYMLQSCKPLADQTIRSVELVLVKLRQDVGLTLQENSQLKVGKARSEEYLSLCQQDKEAVLEKKNRELAMLQRDWDTDIKKTYGEKERLRMERDEMDKQLKETTQSLTKTNAQLVDKMEALQRCQKPTVPLVGRPSAEDIKRRIEEYEKRFNPS